MKYLKKVFVYYIFVGFSLSCSTQNVYFESATKAIIIKVFNEKQRNVLKRSSTSIAVNPAFKKSYFNFQVEQIRDPAFLNYYERFDKSDTLFLFERVSATNHYTYGYILSKKKLGISYSYKWSGYGYEIKIDSISESALKQDDIFKKYKSYLFDFEKTKEKSQFNSGMTNSDILTIGRIILNRDNYKKSKIDIIHTKEWNKPVKIIYE